VTDFDRAEASVAYKNLREEIRASDVAVCEEFMAVVARTQASNRANNEVMREEFTALVVRTQENSKADNEVMREEFMEAVGRTRNDNKAEIEAVRDDFRVALGSHQNDTSTALASLGKRITNVESQQTDHARQMKASENRAERRYKGQCIAMRTMASGLGVHLESFAGGWFLQVLTSKGYPGAEVSLGKKIGDPEEAVSSGTKEVEIDLYCARPLAVGEVTSFLNADEQDKVEKLGRLANLLEKRTGTRPLAYFATFKIDASIKDRAVEICCEYKIELVLGISE
jgi:hypothetical protein